MSESESLAKRWENFRPSKALWLWSCAGCVAATMVLGFGFAGWVTGGTATEMAESAGEDARAQLAATLCVNNFVSSANAATAFEELKEASSWDRDDIIEEGGWATLEGNVEIVDGSLDLCAEKIVAMESLPVIETVQTADAEDTGEATETIAAADAEAVDQAEEIIVEEAEEPEEGAAAEDETEEPVEEAATDEVETDASDT